MFNGLKQALGSVASGAANWATKVSNVLTTDAKIDPVEEDTFRAKEIPTGVEGNRIISTVLSTPHSSFPFISIVTKEFQLEIFSVHVQGLHNVNSEHVGNHPYLDIEYGHHKELDQKTGKCSLTSPAIKLLF